MKKAAICFISCCLFSFSAISQIDEKAALANSCMNELCAGDEFLSTKHPFEQSSNSDLKAATETEIETKLGKALKEWLGVLINRSVVVDGLVKANLPFSEMKLSPDTKALLHLMEILSAFNSYLGAMSWEGGRVLVNVEKLMKLQPQMTTEEAELIRDVYSAYLPVGAVPLEPFLKYLHPKLSYQDALKFEANALADLMSYFQKNIPFGVLLFDYYDLIEKIDVGTISDSDALSLTNAISMRILLNFTLLKEDIKARLQTYELDSKKYEQSYLDYTKSKYYKLLRENKKGIKDDFKSLYSSCKVGLARKFADSPTREEIDLFKSKFERIKELSLQFLNGRIKDIPSEKQKGLADIRLALPKGKDSILAGWQETMVGRHNKTEEQIHLFKEITKDAEQGNLISLLILNMSQRELFTQVQEFCDANEDSGLSDFTLPGFGSITPSNRSIRSGDYGVSVVLHELGHQVSYFLGSSLQGVKSCVALRANNKEQTQEEDFADTFAAEMLNSYPQLTDKKNINMGCGLGRKWGDDWYQLKLEPTGGAHSTYLYRALTFATTYSNLPNSCKRYLESEKNSSITNRCEINEASNP